MPKGLGQHTLKSTGLEGGNEVGVDPKGDGGEYNQNTLYEIL